MKNFKKIVINSFLIIILSFFTTYAFNYVVGKKKESYVYNNSSLMSGTSYSFSRRSPVGTIISYMGESAPESFLECDGKVYNIKDYSYLAEQIKSEFGSYNKFGGNGTTTFAVPDLRGEFLRGRGTNSHTKQGSGSIVGTHQDATVLPYYAVYSSSVYIYGASATFVGDNFDYRIVGSGYYSNIYHDYGNTSSNTSMSFSLRPTNTSVLYAIRYE